MVANLIEGVSDPEVLAKLARGSLRKKIPQLQEALLGRVDAHHQLLLRQILAHIDFLEASLEKLFQEIELLLKPHQAAIELLLSIPGVQMATAASIVGEIGTDMSRFPSAAHLASWVGVCPGNRQSGGRRLRGKINKGNARVKAALAEVVWTLSHMKDNYLSAKSHRLARRIGKPKAVMAVAHSLIVII
jgi:transposase